VTGERGVQLRFDPIAAVTGTETTKEGISVAVRAEGPSLLIVAETFDRGWHASVDGRKMPVLETALGYLAIPLEPGGGTVRLTYRDPALKPAASLSLATLVLVVALAGWRLRGGAPSDRP